MELYVSSCRKMGMLCFNFSYVHWSQFPVNDLDGWLCGLKYLFEPLIRHCTDSLGCAQRKISTIVVTLTFETWYQKFDPTSQSSSIHKRFDGLSPYILCKTWCKMGLKVHIILVMQDGRETFTLKLHTIPVYHNKESNTVFFSQKNLFHLLVQSVRLWIHLNFDLFRYDIYGYGVWGVGIRLSPTSE